METRRKRGLVGEYQKMMIVVIFVGLRTTAGSKARKYTENVTRQNHQTEDWGFTPDEKKKSLPDGLLIFGEHNLQFAFGFV